MSAGYPVLLGKREGCFDAEPAEVETIVTAVVSLLSALRKAANVEGPYGRQFS